MANRCRVGACAPAMVQKRNVKAHTTSTENLAVVDVSEYRERSSK